MTRSERDHHANQLNPNSKAYKDRMDNHANQLNPNNPLYQPKGGKSAKEAKK